MAERTTSTAMSCTPIESLQQQHFVVEPSLLENPCSKASSRSVDSGFFATSSALAPFPIRSSLALRLPRCLPRPHKCCSRT
jgi:hypothetical protein